MRCGVFEVAVFSARARTTGFTQVATSPGPLARMTISIGSVALLNALADSIAIGAADMGPS